MNLALQILHGCPCGATYDALLNVGVQPNTLAKLVNKGFVSAHIERYARPAKLQVVRFAITDAGRKEIQ